jgi:hypothetical protein
LCVTCFFPPLFTEGDEDDEEAADYALKIAVKLTSMDAKEGNNISLLKPRFTMV